MSSSSPVVTAPRWGKAFWRDWTERVGSTLVYALISLVAAGALDLDLSALWPLIGAPVVLSALKGLAANMKDYQSGASLLGVPGPVLTDVDPAPQHRRDMRGAVDLVGALVIAVLVLAIIALVIFLTGPGGLR